MSSGLSDPSCLEGHMLSEAKKWCRSAQNVDWQLLPVEWPGVKEFGHQFRMFTGWDGKVENSTVS